MIPLFSQVGTHTRMTFLGDTEVSGGSLWTDTYLLSSGGLGPLAAAYEAMVHAMLLSNHRKLNRFAYFNVPINTAFINPASVGLLNFGAPLQVYERSVNNNLDAVTVLNTMVATPHGVVLNAADNKLSVGNATLTFKSPHNLVNGQWLITYNFGGVSDDFNGCWCITVVDTVTITLNGCTATGAWNGASGVLTDSTNQWPTTPMPMYDLIRRDEASPNSSSLDSVAWESGVLNFRPCTIPRQVRISYKVSTTAPTSASASTGVDGCLNFLSAYTAALCHKSKGMAPAMTSAFMLACGNGAGECGNANQGYLGQLLREEVKEQQTGDRIVLQRFRPKRMGPLGRGW